MTVGQLIDLDLDLDAGVGAGPSARRVRRVRVPAAVSKAAAVTRAVPHLLTYVGIALLLGAGAFIALAWGRIAGTLDVGLQLPYLASAGFTGVGLAVCGVAVILVDTRATDARARAAQLDALAATLREVREALEVPR